MYSPVVAVLRDRGLEGVVNVADAVTKDVLEPDQHRQTDAAQLQVIGQLLEVDGPLRVLRRMDQDVARRGDREVALPPALDLVEFAGVGDGKHLSCLPVAVRLGCRSAHEIK